MPSQRLLFKTPLKLQIWQKGCFRGLDCDYLHFEFYNENESQSTINVEHCGEESESEKYDDDFVMNDTIVGSMNYQGHNDNIRVEEVVDTEPMEKCAHCESDDEKNQCDKCAKYFCGKCEFALSDMGVQGLKDESILDF